MTTNTSGNLPHTKQLCRLYRLRQRMRRRKNLYTGIRLFPNVEIEVGLVRYLEELANAPVPALTPVMEVNLEYASHHALKEMFRDAWYDCGITRSYTTKH